MLLVREQLMSFDHFCFSSNFSRKLKFVSTLKELSSYVKTDFIFVPDEVIRLVEFYRRIDTS